MHPVLRFSMQSLHLGNINYLVRKYSYLSGGAMSNAPHIKPFIYCCSCKIQIQILKYLFPKVATLFEINFYTLRNERVAAENLFVFLYKRFLNGSSLYPELGLCMLFLNALIRYSVNIKTLMHFANRLTNKRIDVFYSVNVLKNKQVANNQNIYGTKNLRVLAIKNDSVTKPLKGQSHEIFFPGFSLISSAWSH